MSKDVKFNIKINIDGKEGIGIVTTDVKKLRQSFDEAKSSSGQLRDKLITFNQVIGIVQNMSSAVNNLRDVMAGLASSYNAVQQSNTLLTTVMRQRMDATDQDIKKVNEVISAQSQLGVVSGTVQRMGAQQIATFLNEKTTLNTLIPAMNNLIAQQKGVNNTQEDARNIGNLLGKAMQGQTSALRRVGITFTESQEKVMKFGTEQQRAAMLAEIITDNVGNMNAQLGKTDAGQLKHVEMRFAAIKLQVGELAQKYLPQITLTAQALSIVTSLITVSNSMRGVIAVITQLNIAQKLTTASTWLWSTSGIAADSILKSLGVSTSMATAGVYSLRTAVQSPICASVIGTVLVGLNMIITEMISSTDSAANSTKQLSEAEQQTAAAHKQQQQQIAGVVAALNTDIATLRNFKGSKKEEKKVVDDMNQKYGESMGYYSSVSQWYTALVGNSKAYCNQMINEIKIRDLANKAATAEQEAHDIRYDGNGKTRKYSKKKSLEKLEWHYDQNGRKTYATAAGKSDIEKAQERYSSKMSEAKNYRSQMESLVKQNSNTTYNKYSGYSPTSPTTPTSPTKPTKSTPSTQSSPKEDTSLQGQINALQQEINHTKDAGLKEVLQSLLDMLARERTKIQQTAASAAANAGTQGKATSIQQSVVSSSLDMGKIKGVDTSNIKVNVKVNGTDELERMQQAIASLSNIDLQSFSGVQQALQSIASISQPTAQGFAAAGAACSALGGALQQLGEDSAAAKAGMVIAAIGQLVLSFSQAMVSAAQAGWIAWLAFGIAGTAQLISLIATISGFTTGGVVAGSQERGDKLMVGVNSGEMILNKAQQRRLFDIANGNVSTPRVDTSPGRLDYSAISSVAMMAAASAQPQVVEFRIKGNSLYGVMQNHRRISGKSYRI